MKHSELRKQTVMQMLRTTKKLTIEKAMEVLDVSESTVRRLFAQLENEGVAIRITADMLQRLPTAGLFEPKG